MMANKRVIDLSTLSETVQEGQYILVDSSGGTGKMNLKKVVDDSTETLADQVEQNTQDIENLSGDLETLEGRVDDAEEAIAEKADADGVYNELYAGNLISDKMQEDETPYLFRKTASELGSSRIGQRCYETIIGASVGENQLVTYMPSGMNNGITYTWNNDGSYTLNGTATENSYRFVTSGIPANHVGFASVISASSDVKMWFAGYTGSQAKEKILKPSGSYSVCLFVPSGVTLDNVKAYPQFTDLTQKFGSTIADYIYSLETATAGAGISKLREWGFLRGYQAYNAGSIESVEVTGKVVRGFNAWDEEWEVGSIGSDGGDVSTTSRIRSKNYIPIIPNATYYIKWPVGIGAGRGAFYDAEKRLVSYISDFYRNQTFTTPNTAHYMRFSPPIDYGTTYNHDICINLSNSDRNGEYEPYKSTTYSLGDDTLNGIFNLDANNNLYADGDRKEADGTITRKMKSKTLEQVDVTYSLNNSGYANIAYARITKPSDAKGLNSANPLLILLDGYVTSSATSGWDAADKIGYLFYGADTAYWLVGFPHGTTIEQMKSTLAGKELIYELATPTTETSTPFTSPQIVYPDGTEEFITENGVPVGHETEYPYDLKELVEGLIDVPDVPSANGTYVLKATRSASGITYNWVTG